MSYGRLTAKDTDLCVCLGFLKVSREQIWRILWTTSRMMAGTPLARWLRRCILLLICGLALVCRLHKVAVVGTGDLHDGASPGTPLFDYRAALEMATGIIPPQHAASHPGLAVAAALAHWLLGAAGMAVDVQDVCALLVPVCAALSCVLMYVLGKEVSGDDAVGLVSAALLAVLPALTASTVSGSFGAQGLALFPLLFLILYYLRALKGEQIAHSISSASAASVALVLVSLTWRAYAVFLSFLIPFHIAYLNLCCAR